MGAEDEFRKVAEDVRELARTLRQELRSAQKDARRAAHQARDEIRTEWSQHRRSDNWSGWQGWQNNNWNQGDGQGRRTQGGPHYRSGPPVRTARPPAPPRPPKPSRRRPPYRHKHDSSTLLSLLLVLLGLAWLVSETHLFNLSLEAVLAVGLVVLGAGMVVTARTDWSLSRKSWPVCLGLIMLFLLIAGANSSRIGDGLASLRFGPADFTPSNWASAGGTVTDFAGPIRVDLTQLTGTLPNGETLTIRDTFGPVTVIVPTSPKYNIIVSAQTVFGPVAVPAGAQGTGRHGNRTFEITGTSTGAPTLVVDAKTVAGPVTVDEGSSPQPSAPGAPIPPTTPAI